MAKKKEEYINDKIYPKLLALTGRTINAIEKLCESENRKFKPYVEKRLDEIAEDYLTRKKKKENKK